MSTFTAPENVTTIRPGDTIILPVDIRKGVLPGISKGATVQVENSFQSENPKYWILHVFVPGSGVVSRSVSLNVDMLVPVVE